MGPPAGDEYLQAVHPEDRNLLLQTRREVLTPGQTRTIHFRSDPDLGPPRHFVEIV